MSGAHRPIIVKRKKVAKGGHHGGAWKIAYADFMTALMALFLVLWILAQADESELKTIAEYFRTPLPVAMAGGNKNTASTSAIPGGGPAPAHINGEEARVDRRQETRTSDEQQRLINLERRIEAVIESKPNLRDMRSQMRMSLTTEGLRIQLVDSDRRPMFERGSDRVAPYMSDILRAIAPVLNELPNSISLSGHSDSVPYVNGEKGYSNWELSADRANASRRELVAGGLNSDRLLRVAGMGSRVPLTQADANDAANRRISIVVLDKKAAESIERQSMRSWPQPNTTVENSAETSAENPAAQMEAIHVLPSSASPTPIVSDAL